VQSRIHASASESRQKTSDHRYTEEQQRCGCKRKAIERCHSEEKST